MDRNYLEKVIGILFNAKVHYRLWEELMKRRDADSVALISRGYSTFFEYTREAHFKTFIVELHKLVETRNDTYNIPTIVKMIAGNKNLENYICEYLDQIQDTKNAIFILRNEVEAHSTNKNSPTESFTKANITSEDIDGYLASTAQILNRIGKEYFNSLCAFNEIGEADSICRIFSAISKYENA